MDDKVTIAVIGALGVVFGSLITAAFTYRSTAQAKSLEKNRLFLLRCWRNIAAFHELEKRYTEALAKPDRTDEALKREVRKQQREAGSFTPDTTEQEAKNQIQRLSD